MMSYLEYKPAIWDKIFVNEKANLHFHLPQYKFNVEHIGATSVPNCRSFRNVDIMISLHDFKDIHTVALLLATKEYKIIKERSTPDCMVLAKTQKYQKVGVTIRIVQYAGRWFNRCHAFLTLLRENYDRVIKYNNFREELFVKVNGNIAQYNQIKGNYINSIIDDNFKFE